MILALAWATDNLYSPDQFNLNQQTSRQWSPLSVYVCLWYEFVSALHETSSTINLQHDRWKFPMARNIKPPAAHSGLREVGVHHSSSMQYALPTEFGVYNDVLLD